MKVCIPVSEVRGLESPVHGHFGSAPAFLAVDSATLATEELANGDREHVHGACSPVRALAGDRPWITEVSGGPFKDGEAPSRAPVEVRTHLPGNVHAVLCAAGDQVNKGDTLIIVEAMKMESPIYAPGKGVVLSVEVEKGQTVNSGEVLVVLS